MIKSICARGAILGAMAAVFAAAVLISGPASAQPAREQAPAAQPEAPAADATAEPAKPPRARVRVFAAASLTQGLSAVAEQLAKKSNLTLIVSFGASSTLARQIELGGPADIFISADEKWMDYLDERVLLVPGTRRNLLGNRLVLVAPKDSKTKLKLDQGADVLAALGDSRLAMADPDHVPAGRYAKAAFESYGLWDKIEERTARAGDVQAALKMVERGEAPLGVVYASDVFENKNVRVLDTIAEGAHPRIVYPIAIIAGDPSSIENRLPARRVYDYLISPEARTTFQRFGFILP